MCCTRANGTADTSKQSVSFFHDSLNKINVGGCAIVFLGVILYKVQFHLSKQQHQQGKVLPVGASPAKDSKPKFNLSDDERDNLIDKDDLQEILMDEEGDTCVSEEIPHSKEIEFSVVHRRDSIEHKENGDGKIPIF